MLQWQDTLQGENPRKRKQAWEQAQGRVVGVLPGHKSRQPEGEQRETSPRTGVSRNVLAALASAFA